MRAGEVSPYMSVTTTVRPERVRAVPAVVHVDGTARLQTVTPADEPVYWALIAAFFALTGVPMVLNTSFNTIPGEPIVETPADALRSFLLRAAPPLARVGARGTRDAHDAATAGEEDEEEEDGAVWLDGEAAARAGTPDDDAAEEVAVLLSRCVTSGSDVLSTQM